METKIHKGGTAKGVGKPHAARSRERCGVKHAPQDGYMDVKLACKRFIRDRVERGEMREYGFEFQYGGGAGR